MYTISNQNEKVVIDFPAKSFKRFSDPYDEREKKAAKFQCFVNIQDIPEEFENWMEVNPREQNLGTDVSKSIRQSLLDEGNEYFHLLNRGLLISVEKITFNNKTDIAEIVLSDKSKHGIIDGGHTFKIICKNKDSVKTDKYVSLEFVEDFDAIEVLAETRNTSVAVDDSSMEELKGSFDCFKEILAGHRIGNDEYLKRVRFKQNEHRYDEDIKSNIIDIKEIIAISNMFNPRLYKPQESVHPIQSYSGKEVSLRKFLNIADPSLPEEEKVKDRNQMIKNMGNIIKDVLQLWDTIELEFPDVSKDINRKYGSKKYSNFNNDAVTKVSLFSNKEMKYSIPKGIMYPCVGAFRALIDYNEKTGEISWAKGFDPFKVWDKMKNDLVSMILDNSKSVAGDKPEIIGKSQIIWDALFKQVLIYRLLNEKNER